jgi:hypothetical protein
VGVAVKVTGVPEHIAPDGRAAMETLTGRCGFTSIVIVFEVAGFPVIHVSDEVITTWTLSLFPRADDEKVGLFDPTFPPLTFH